MANEERRTENEEREIGGAGNLGGGGEVPRTGKRTTVATVLHSQFFVLRSKYLARASCQSGSGPPITDASLLQSSTLYAGRFAFVPNSAVVIGRTSTSILASRKISRANSHHVMLPEFVAWYSPNSSVAISLTKASARSAVEVGVQRWSSTTRSCFRSRPSRSIVSTKFPLPPPRNAARPYRPQVRTAKLREHSLSTNCSPVHFESPYRQPGTARSSSVQG